LRAQFKIGAISAANHWTRPLISIGSLFALARSLALCAAAPVRAANERASELPASLSLLIGAPAKTRPPS